MTSLLAAPNSSYATFSCDAKRFEAYDTLVWRVADFVGNTRRWLRVPFRMPDRTHRFYMTLLRSPLAQFQRSMQALRLMLYGCKAGAMQLLVAIILVAAVEWPRVSVGSDSPRPVANPAVVHEQEFQRQPTWSIPTRSEVRHQVLAWLDGLEAPVGKLADARAIWAQSESLPSAEIIGMPTDILDDVMSTCAIVDERCANLELAMQDRVSGEGVAALSGEFAWLNEPSTNRSDTFEQQAVKLWLGRELVRQDRFDEGLAQLADLDPATVLDPAALLFHRAACQHWLLKSDAAIASLEQLLERAQEIPVRYERVARLLRADMTSLEDESLDHIARRMRDVTRRLGLGRAGPKTRRVQDGVIESLDKLIASIEKQQQDQSGGGGSGGSGKGGTGKPMDDSRIAGGKGPGDVTRRDIGDTEGWGNLPPHKREEALQQIGREFPAHYREAIEQYFKRLAAGNESP